MKSRLSAIELLRQARDHYDVAGSPLPAAARAAAARGFAGGAEWMAAALSTLRAQEVTTPADVHFQWLGIAKYLAALCVAVAAGALAYLFGLNVLSPLVAILAFYAIEVQSVFLFPLAIDRSAHPFFQSRVLLLRSAGTMRGVCTVIPIACSMLFGGFPRRRFIRAWAIGCLAVCIWYERARQSDYVSRRARWEFAGWQPLLVRHETVRGAPAELAGETTILYVSDLHLGRFWTAGLADEIAQIARGAAPDAILLGGDLVDTQAGLPLLAMLVHSLAHVAAVYAIDGNHDRRFGVPAIRTCAEREGAVWLDYAGRPLGERMVIYGAIPGLSEDSSRYFRMLCAHDPAIFDAAASAGMDLVLAGHLHGGQCVILERAGRLFPGAWINCWTGLRFKQPSSTMLVSRGAGDTLPFRWNCPREVLLCRIQH